MPISVIRGEITAGIDFGLDPMALFRDGFEPGGPSAWSKSAGVVP